MTENRNEQNIICRLSNSDCGIGIYCISKKGIIKYFILLIYIFYKRLLFKYLIFARIAIDRK